MLGGTGGKFLWHGKDSLSEISDLECCFATQKLIGLRTTFLDDRRAEVLSRLVAASSAAGRRNNGVWHFRVGRVNCFQRSRRPRARWEFRVNYGVSGPVVLSSLLQTVRVSSITRGAVATVLRRNMWGLGGLRLQGVIEDKKLSLQKVHNASNPADLCTTALPGDEIRELCPPCLRVPVPR